MSEQYSFGRTSRGLSCGLTFNIISDFNCQCICFAKLEGFASIGGVVRKEKTSCFY